MRCLGHWHSPVCLQVPTGDSLWGNLCACTLFNLFEAKVSLQQRQKCTSTRRVISEFERCYTRLPHRTSQASPITENICFEVSDILICRLQPHTVELYVSVYSAKRLRDTMDACNNEIDTHHREFFSFNPSMFLADLSNIVSPSHKSSPFAAFGTP